VRAIRYAIERKRRKRRCSERGQIPQRRGAIGDGIALIDEQGLIIEWNGQKRKSPAFRRPMRWPVLVGYSVSDHGGGKKNTEVHQALKEGVLQVLKTGAVLTGKNIGRQRSSVPMEPSGGQVFLFPVKTRRHHRGSVTGILRAPAGRGRGPPPFE